MRHATVRIAILSGITFLSGIGALIFETLWLRLSGLAFGNSVWAAALILSSFMAGLALGNALAASSRIRRWRPLYVYAALELAVALFGCTIIFGLPLLGAWLRPVFQTLWNHQTSLIALRLLLSFVILVVPTTAMGLTLPVLLEDPILGKANFARVLGFLYGFNTLGAMTGALVGEGLLVAAFGLGGTGMAAGLANCAAGAAACLLARTDPDTGPVGWKQTAPAIPFRRSDLPWRLLAVSFGTGSILLCLEVVWFRFLRLYVASSSTAFAVMLAVVLAGIGLGGIVWGALARCVVQPRKWLAQFLMLAASVVLVAYIFFPAEAVQTREDLFNFDSWWAIGLLSVALMFPVALLSGILFAAIVSAVQTRVEDRMNSTGITTLFNTTGAAVGPLLASFVLLPGIGFQSSLILCAGGYVLLGILVSERATWSVMRPFGMLAVALSAAFVLILIVFPYNREASHFAHAALPYQADPEARSAMHVVKRVEGTADSLQLLRRDFLGRPLYYQLLTNAVSMSSTRLNSQRYMRLFAYLPLAFRPQTRNALLICYGCGVTADALVRESRLQHIDVVDISREVLHLADDYVDIEFSNPLRDPRVTAFVQDGRFFLQASPRQYDIITGEPPPPKMLGSVNLYTGQFFSLMKSRLKPGGIVTFWLPIYQLKVDETKAILRAFHEAFPNASVWGGPNEEWIMMGINGAAEKITKADLRRLWSDPRTGPDLIRIGVEVPQQLGALFLMDGEEIGRLTQTTRPLTDFYPKRLTDERADESASHHFANTYIQASGATERFRWSALMNNLWPDNFEESIDSFFIVRETRYLSETIGSNKLAELDLYLRHSHLRTPVLEVLRSNESRVAIAEKVAAQATSPLAETVPDLVAGALARRDIAGAIRLLESERNRDQNESFLLTYLYCVNGEVDKAEALAAVEFTATTKDAFVDWLWQKLHADFGFHPPS